LTDTKATTKKTKLDWSKLLGFDQVKQVDHGDLRLTDLGFSKIGGKSCVPPPA
jgi:hypothetical protein